MVYNRAGGKDLAQSDYFLDIEKREANEKVFQDRLDSLGTLLVGVSIRYNTKFESQIPILRVW